MRAANQNKKRAKAGLLGVGFDCEDGHTRITRGDNFFLLGGSHETHELMQATVVKVNEQLQGRGKRLEDVSVPELRDILHQVHEDVQGS